MEQNKKETTKTLSPAYPRYIAIDENIHATLSLYALSLYMAFRFEADYRQEESKIKRSAKYLYTKAKISRPQYYRVLNELENHGLILRDEENKLGDCCIFHVARELNYFNKGISQKDTPVSDRDTDHYSLSNNNTNSKSCDSLETATPVNRKKPSIELRSLINIYCEIFPDNPQPHPRVISTTLQKTLQTLIKKWPTADPTGNQKPFNLESFRRYLEQLRYGAPKFSLGEYTTKDGNIKKNNMETFCRWNTFVQFLEGKYS